MKFRGNYSYSIDSKGRIMLPNAMKTTLKENGMDKLIILPGFSQKYKYLFLLPKNYSDKIENHLENLKFFDVNAQKIFTFFFGNSFEIELDQQGRIRIPKPLINRLGLEGEVMITGEGDFMKIWLPNDYNNMIEEELSPDSEDLSNILKSINEKYDI
jgi:MraZ protein